MPPNHCALCDKTITLNNDSREHVILKAIGGRLAVRGFLCRECNNTSGSEWDAALASQLAPWGLRFGISSVPPQIFQTLYGDPVKVHVEGFQTTVGPSCERTEKGYHLRAPNDKVARQILEGLIARHPEQSWDVERFLADAKRTAFFNDMWRIPLAIGGSQAGRSIVKSALALAFHAGIAPSDCELACAYLRQNDGPPCFDYHYIPDIVVSRETGTPLHCVHIRANPARQTLMAYIELFGLYRIVACLSRKYTGLELTKTYAINPVTDERVQLEIKWHEALEQPMPQPTREVWQQYIQEVWIPVLDAAQEEWGRREMAYEIESAMNAAVQKSGKKKGDSMTEEEWRQIIKDVLHHLEPWVVSQYLSQNSNAVKGIIQIGDDPQFDPRSFLDSYYQSLN